MGCSRAVICCGSTLARPGSPLDAVRAALGSRGAGVFSGVRAHSPLPAVEAAAAALKECAADVVIAVGGGSAIVTARAASILSAEGGDPRALCTRPDGRGGLHSPKLLAPKLPQLVVPTTPTTAIVKAGSAMLDPETHARLALFDPKTRVQAVFIDPAMLESAPRELLLSASLNTLTLAIEGLLSRSGDPIADALLMHAVRLLVSRLPQIATSDDSSVRSDLMLASILAGQGSDYTGAGMAIPLGHAVGAKFQVDNGITDAIVLPHVMRFNASAATAGFEKLAAALALASPSAVVPTIEALFAKLNVPRRLRDIGVNQASIAELAAVTMDDWFLKSNPRRVESAMEVQRLLGEAW